MADILLISKEDISELITDVQNFDETKINREIFDTQEFNFRNQIPPSLYNAFIAIKQANYKAWSKDRAYVIGDYVIREKKLFISIQDGTNKNPETETAYWTEKILYNKFITDIIPFLVFVSYSKYCTEHGLNASPNGFLKANSNDFATINEKERGMVVNKYQSRGDKYFMRFMKYLSDVKNIIDGVTYTFTCDNSTRTSPKLKFKGV